MRKIGSVVSQRDARQFQNVLHVRGVAATIERGDQGWEVWVEHEDRLEEARDLLAQFQAGELDAEQERAAVEAERQRLREKLAEAQARDNVIDVRNRWRSESFLSRGLTPLTAGLIVISVVVAVITGLGRNLEARQPFHITEFDRGGGMITWERGLPEVRHGQLWRLLTPIFLHFGILHIVFNMLWLKDLGGMVERRQGWAVLLGMVVVMGVGPNLVQYGWSGPSFGGMSGVVYGLLGYVWMRGKLDPGSGYRLDPRTAAWMGIWLVLCMTGMMGPVANAAHVAGLVVGVAWGALASGTLRRMLGP